MNGGASEAPRAREPIMSGGAAEGMPIVAVEGLHKRYGDVEVLQGIDFAAAAGEVVCILGPSGSGKSTLLRCISRLTPPTRGTVRIEGVDVGDPRVDINKVRRRVGMVFQSFNLFPHKTAAGNVMLALRTVAGMEKTAARDEAIRQLDRVGLAEKADAYPSQLSGGQQQRVAIARALAMAPRMMMFDEATSALDPELVGEVLDVMRSLAADGMGMLVVTHEIGFAREVAHRIVFMDEGRIVEEGAPGDVLDRPQQQRTQAFMSKIL